MTLSAGFFGKIPARGDFVRHGLPSAFVAALDAWWQRMLPASRARLGEAWIDAWMEAPIWRFLLPAGSCGPDAAAGLWLPSTDKAGRLFPLVIALAAPSWPELARCGAFLDAAETIGLAAIERDVPPEQLAAAVAAAARSDTALSAGDSWPEPRTGIWWTAGSDRVAPGRRLHPGMPDEAAFTAMLQDGALAP